MSRVLLGTVAAAAALVALPSPAGAETRLVVEAGWDGRYRPGRPVPVRVEIRADRLIEGTLSVGAGDGTEVSLRVEVPGGSVKEYLLVVPTAPYDEDATVRARVRAGDESAAGADEIEYDPALELVGLLPAVTPIDLPGAVPLAVETGVAGFVEVGDDVLTAPGALGSLGTIVAGPDELSQLGGTARQSLLAWVDAGGRLLVDATPGTRINGLPEPWQPGDAGRATAGRGEIRLTDGAATAGRWTEILEPTPNIAGDDLRRLAEFGLGFGAVSDGIARDAGLRITTPGWLLGFLVAYVVFAIPVAWIVLRRLKRPSLAWVVIPVVAVVFAGATFVIGRDLRGGTTAAQGTLISAGPVGASAHTVVGAVSKNGGDGEVTFPEGWSLSAVDQTFLGLEPGQVAVVLSGDATTGTVPLDAGEFGLLRGEGPIEFAGGLEIEAAVVDDDTVGGTVRNTTSVPLEEVGVFVGRHGTNVGTIEPGEEEDFTVDLRVRRDPFEPTEVDVWPEALGWDRSIDPDSVVNIGLWSEVLRAGGPNLLPSGSAVAVGWTRQLEVPVRAGRLLEGRGAVLGRAPVETGAPGALNPAAVRHEVLRTGEGAESVLEAFDATRDFTGHVVRLVLPDGASTDGLELQVGPDVSGVQVWRGGEWDTIDDEVEEINPNVGIVPGNSREIDVPAEAVDGGTIFLRLVSNPFFGPGAVPTISLDSDGITP